MIPESVPLLLDTGVIIHLCRGGVAAEQIEQRYRLTRRRDQPMISVITRGEALAFALRNRWGRPRLNTLAGLFTNFPIIDLNREIIIESYARLNVKTLAIGRRMGQQNDLWIAATAVATGAVLLTPDRDFDDLHPAELVREWIDPVTLR